MGSKMSVKGSDITDAQAVNGQFGDGIIVMPWTVPSEVSLENILIDASDRAGLSNFGSIVAFKNVLIKCAAFELNHEIVPKDLFGPGIPPQDILTFTYDDQGGNSCGCPVADSDCHSVSAGLEPSPPNEAAN